ncbi:MAG: hypothetical protein F4Z11_01475 [Cenarchaeum sp. SB0666_bin_15]|nr:hypothetical protein [Cenarchaeum sp. SB0666_bin_15]
MPKGGIVAGNLPHGKHAQTNLGVSLLRGGRELNMDQNLIQTYNPLERWWGAEIEFPPALDEFFGINNNKQDATNFTAMTKHFIRVQDDERVSGDESENTGSDGEEDMSRIVSTMLRRIRSMRRGIKKQEEGRKSIKDERHDKDGSPQPTVFTSKIENRRAEGHMGTTDQQMIEQTKEERIENVKQKIKDYVPPSELDQKALSIVEDKEKVRFQKGELSGFFLFDINFSGGVEIITINTNHNAYKNLLSLVEDLPNEMTIEEAVVRLTNAKKGLRLLLSSWARMEDEKAHNDKKRKELGDTRYDWCKMMDKFLDI